MVKRGAFPPGVDYASVGSCCEEPDPIAHSSGDVDACLKNRVQGNVDTNFLENIDCGGKRRILERSGQDQTIAVGENLSSDTRALLADLPSAKVIRISCYFAGGGFAVNG